jgi:hypothetical protein
MAEDALDGRVGVNQVELAGVAAKLPAQNAWFRALIERTSADWTLRYGRAVLGQEPVTWPGKHWRYESLIFLAITMPARELVGAFSSDADGRLRMGDFDVVLPRVQPTGRAQHRPSFELHDRDRTPLPSFEYAFNRVSGDNNVSSAGRMDFLVGPDSPSFTDVDSAYRGFFLGKYEVPANESVPSGLMQIRVLDEGARLGPIHIRASEMTVEVHGSVREGTTLEYFSPDRRERYSVDSSGVFTIGLPEGLPPTNTWLWLTEGNAWHDYRALTPPWASDEQLVAAGVEKEQTSRDEQAAVEAIVYGGEGPFVEFKSILPKAGSKTDRAFNTIAAFANGAGGTVVFGVDRDELTVVGLGEDADPNKERDRVGQLIRTRVLPTPEFLITAYEVDANVVLFVQVKPGLNPPYAVITDLDHRDKPQFYVRRGASTYPAQPSDLNEMLRPQQPWQT